MNWLDLVRKIRIENKGLFELFLEQLEKSNYGGKEGLNMATISDVLQLEITCEFAKLALEQEEIPKQQLTLENIKKLITWYFLNKTKDKGISPATDKILHLSDSVRSLLNKVMSDDEVLRFAIKALLEVRKECEVIERNCEEKRVPVNAALTLNKRFNKCYEELLGVFMHSDALCSYFAFDIGGLTHILSTMDIAKDKEGPRPLECTPEEEILLNEKLVSSKPMPEKVAAPGKDVEELKD